MSPSATASGGEASVAALCFLCALAGVPVHGGDVTQRHRASVCFCNQRRAATEADDSCANMKPRRTSRIDKVIYVRASPAATGASPLDDARSDAHHRSNNTGPEQNYRSPLSVRLPSPKPWTLSTPYLGSAAALGVLVVLAPCSPGDRPAFCEGVTSRPCPCREPAAAVCRRLGPFNEPLSAGRS